MNRSTMPIRLSAICLTMALGTFQFAVVGEAKAAETQNISIEAQSLAGALREFSDQTGMQLAYIATLADNKASPGTAGASGPSDALTDLLEGTDLEYQYVNDDTVAIGPDRLAKQGTSASRSAPQPILLAQNNPQAQASEQDRSDTSTGSQQQSQEDSTNYEEIVVTGTRIKGIAPVGSPSITITREEIEAAGYVTTEDIIRGIPQNFAELGGEIDSSGLGVSGTILGAAARENRSGSGSSVNLRGLGAASTLTVLNGRRLAPAGRGAFVDLSVIPASMIERIEILTDGASAIYGSDAVGGVVNIILRKDFDGAQTSVNYFTVADGDHDAVTASQLIGKSWDNGGIMAAYEYYDRTPLARSERPQALNDLTSLGGTDWRRPGGVPGTISTLPTFSGPGVTYAIPAGQDGTALTPADFATLAGTANLAEEDRDLILPSTRNSVFVAFRQNLSDRTELLAEVRYSDVQSDLTASQSLQALVPTSNAFYVDPTGSPFPDPRGVSVNYDATALVGPARRNTDETNYGGSLGITTELGSDWEVDVFASIGKSDQSSFSSNQPNSAALNAALADGDPTTALNLFGAGANTTNPATIASIYTGFRDDTSEYEVKSIDAVFGGSLFELPGGAVKTAIGASYRDETLEYGGVDFRSGPTAVPLDQFGGDRNVTGAFVEFYVPLVSEQNSRPGIESFAVSLAARYDDYSDFGSTVNPKFGVSWALSDSFSVRGSYGTSFRAPLVAESNAGPFDMIIVGPVADPMAPFGTSFALVNVGNNPDLNEEEATTWTVGFDYSPQWAENLNFKVNYYNVEFENQIFTPTIFGTLPREDEFDSIVVRPTEVADFAAHVNSVAYSNGDPLTGTCLIAAAAGGCAFLPFVGLTLDVRNNNFTKTELRGYDFNVSYRFATDIGDIGFGLNAQYQTDLERALTDLSPLVNVINTFLQPSDLTLRGSASWSNDAWAVNAFINYVAGFDDNSAALLGAPTGLPDPSISSYTTTNLNIRYDLGRNTDSAILDGFGVALTINNLFDRDPPFLDKIRGGYDPTKGSVIGRTLALRLTKSW